MSDLKKVKLKKRRVQFILKEDGPFSFLSRYSRREMFIDEEWWFCIEQYYQYFLRKQNKIRNAIRNIETVYQLKRLLSPITIIDYTLNFPIPLIVSRKNKKIELCPVQHNLEKLEKITEEKFKQHIYLIPQLLFVKSNIVDKEFPEYGKILEKIKRVCKPLNNKSRLNFDCVDIDDVKVIIGKLEDTSSYSKIVTSLKNLSSVYYVNQCLRIVQSQDVSDIFITNINCMYSILQLLKGKVKKNINEVAVLIAVCLALNRGKFTCF